MTTLLDAIKREHLTVNQADLASLNQRIRATRVLLTTLRRRRAELELAERLERGVMTVSEAIEHLEPRNASSPANGRDYDLRPIGEGCDLSGCEPLPADLREPDFSERVERPRWRDQGWDFL